MRLKMDNDVNVGQSLPKVAFQRNRGARDGPFLGSARHRTKRWPFLSNSSASGVAGDSR
jgi:hypothetical protein